MSYVFTAFRSILEKCLSEEICLELKAALKYLDENKLKDKESILEEMFYVTE